MWLPGWRDLVKSYDIISNPIDGTAYLGANERENNYQLNIFQGTMHGNDKESIASRISLKTFGMFNVTTTEKKYDAR